MKAGGRSVALVSWLSTAAAAFVLLIASRALAAPPADAPLTVHVTTPDRQSVPGAAIAIERGGHRTVFSSGDDGLAKATIPPGTYGLVASMTGYLSTRMLIQLPSSGLLSEI